MTPGTCIGAFFDIDGTLLPPPSLEWRFASWLLDCGLLSSLRVAKWGAFALSALSTGDASAARVNKAYLGGLSVSAFDDWEASLAVDELTLFPAAEERIAFHLESGHRVVFVSGTLAPLARALARRIDDSMGVYATELGEICGTCSGRVQGKHLSGTAKAEVVVRVAREFGMSLAESYAYGNHLDDFAMLDSVGHPAAVNPTRQLRRIAQQRHWDTLRWESRGPARVLANKEQFVSAKVAH